MINPPDDLLADLQSALPPEQQVTSPPSGEGRANGHAHLDEDHFYDRTMHDNPERASVASTSTVGGWGLRAGVGLRVVGEGGS